MDGKVKTMILFDDTSIRMTQSSDNNEFSIIEPILNFLLYYKDNIVVETSTKVWEEIEKLKGTETYEYIRVLINPSDITSAVGQDTKQSIIELVDVYATTYENIWLITKDEYSEINHNCVIVLKPEDLHEAIMGDKKFQEYLKNLNGKIEERNKSETAS